MRLQKACLLLSVLLAACAAPPRDQAMMTYESSPAGAKIYQGTNLLGVAPVSQVYKTEGKPSLDSPVVTAVWLSGAKVTYWTRLKPGDDLVAKLERPANAPKLEVDLAEADRVNADDQHAQERAKNDQLRAQKRDSAACQNAMSQGNMLSANTACN